MKWQVCCERYKELSKRSTLISSMQADTITELNEPAASNPLDDDQNDSGTFMQCITPTESSYLSVCVKYFLIILTYTNLKTDLAISFKI